MKRLIILSILTSMLGLGQSHSNTLSWNWSQGTGDIATGFHVWRSISLPVSITGTALTTLPVTTLTYIDANVVPGQTWNYVITAFNTGGDSVPSNSVTCTTPFQAPTGPTTLSSIVK